MELKGNSGELSINIMRRSNNDSLDYWDANWLEAEIRINNLTFNALYGINLRVEELQVFYENIFLLQERKKNEIEFITIEEGIYLKMITEKNGDITCQGVAKNMNGDKLTFKFNLEYTTIDVFINQLELVLKAYPLVGRIE